MYSMLSKNEEGGKFTVSGRKVHINLISNKLVIKLLFLQLIKFTNSSSFHEIIEVNKLTVINVMIIYLKPQPVLFFQFSLYSYIYSIELSLFVLK